MRSLDKSFITPVLREYDLLRVNADGVMMTRSLAENYPYTKLYKAAIRGARDEWLEIVDLLEAKELDPYSALRHLIAMLLNRTEAFESAVKQMIKNVSDAVALEPSAGEIIAFIHNFVDSSDYSARVFEVAMHSLFQVLEEWGFLEGSLKPLS